MQGLPPSTRLRYEPLAPHHVSTLAELFAGDTSPYLEPSWHTVTGIKDYISIMCAEPTLLNQGLDFMAFRQPNNHPVGIVQAFDCSNESWGSACGIAYAVGRAHRRQGYGRELVAAVRDYVFDTLDYPLVLAHVEDGNEASIRLLDGLGFERMLTAGVYGLTR